MHYPRDWFLLHRRILAYINLSVDPFQKGRSRRSRRTFLFPVVNHFINLRRIMQRVKRHSEVNDSSAPSLSRGAFLLFIFADFLFKFARISRQRKRRKDKYTILFLIDKKQCEINYFSARWKTLNLSDSFC